MDTNDSELIFAADFGLKESADFLSAETLQTYPELQQQYILTDAFYDCAYLVNESIYCFLQLFSSPARVSTIYTQLDVEDDASKKQIQSFLHDLQEKEILVTPERNAFVIKQMTKTKEVTPADIGVRQVIKVLKHTSYIWIGVLQDSQKSEPYVLKKLLLPSTLSEQEQKKKIREFEHEASMHKAVSTHPNIVTLQAYDSNTHEIQLAFVEGRSIRKFVHTCCPSLEDKLDIIKKILQLFAYLHQNNILHGDIHSSNFLVTAEKEPMLLDFDMARHAHIEEKQAAKVGGVYPYAPPERISTKPLQVFNRVHTNAVSEVYQLGIVFYLLLYHALPFDGITWKTLSGNILTLTPVWKPETAASEAIPERIITTLKKALEKDVKDRYVSVHEFAKAWESATCNQPRMAPPLCKSATPS